jgi:hypothetical protein
MGVNTAMKNNDNIHDSSRGGRWEEPFESKVVGIHTSLLHNGKVLSFSYPSKENHHHNHQDVKDDHHIDDIHSHGSGKRTGVDLFSSHLTFFTEAC